MKRLIVFVLAMIILSPAFGVEQAAADKKKVDPSETKKQQEAYDAAVGQCQSQAGAAKQECVEAAKTKYGEMLK